MSEEIEEILVPCPNCRKVHKVPVKKIKENKTVTVDCGATLGSVGLMRRVEEAEARAKEFRGRLHKLG
jgi:lysyl-tRNA synthetase class I